MLELNIYIIGEKINFTLPGQDGMWVKFYHFWPKNDGEKWSRKNILVIPPCAFFFTSSQNGKCINKK